MATGGSTAARSSETFEEFYAREFRAVVGLAYALSGSRAGAEDLAQEAFLVAHRDWDKISGYDSPGYWIRRVVANLSVSMFRRRLVEAKALARMAVGSPTVLPGRMSRSP
jgi:RNA polymerase sigma-70 factor (ECF subfamily)